MSTIIYFIDDPKKKGVIRFVSSFRKGNWFRKDKNSYSLSLVDSEEFSDNTLLRRSIDRIKKDYPNAEIKCDSYSSFDERYSNQRFWLICRLNNSEYEDYYFGNDSGNKPCYTTDFGTARMYLTKRCANETLLTIQRGTRDRVFCREVVLNLVNELLTPQMMIVCEGKRSGVTKFFSRIEGGNRLRLVSTSGAATLYNYDMVMYMYEYLIQHNKNFNYAVLPKFNDNVNYKDIERYIREKKVSRMVVVDLQLKYINR